MANGIDTLPEDQEVPVSGIASFLPGPGGADFPIPPTYVGPPSDEPGFDILNKGTEAYESLPIWEQVALGVTPAGTMADIMMAAKYGRDTLEEFIAENYGAAAVAATMTALAGVGFIPGVGDAVKVGGQKLLRKLGVPKPRVKWRPDMPPEEKAQWFKQYQTEMELPYAERMERRMGETFEELRSYSPRQGIERLLPFEQAKKVRQRKLTKQDERFRGLKEEDLAYQEEQFKRHQRQLAEDSELFAPLDVDKIKREIEVEGETLGEYVPTLDEELDNVVDFPRRGGIENLIHPDLLKKRVFLWEEYGLDEADLVRLTKTMQEYEATGVLHADFSRKLTPQDLRDITGIEGGNPWEPDNFAYGGGVNSLYIDQGVPVNGIASFRPSV